MMLRPGYQMYPCTGSHACLCASSARSTKGSPPFARGGTGGGEA